MIIELTCIKIYIAFNKTKHHNRKKRRQLAKKFKEVISIEDIELDPESVRISEAEGLNEKTLRLLIWKLLNGIPDINKKT